MYLLYVYPQSPTGIVSLQRVDRIVGLFSLVREDAVVVWADSGLQRRAPKQDRKPANLSD